MGLVAVKGGKGAKPKDGDADLTPIVLEAMKGDERALGKLVEATQDSLFRFCFFLTSDRARAEDLAQETYLKAFEALPKLREPARFSSWLLKMAKNAFLDDRRAARNKGVVSIDDPESGAESLLTQSEGGEATVQERDQAIEVHRQLSKLDSEDRVLLILVDLEGRSYAEAGEVLGVSEDAVRSRLHRVRKDFVKKFSEG